MTATPDLCHTPNRRGYAMGLMVISSVSISFGGLVIRSMQDADVWQISFYRSIALAAMILLVMILRYAHDTPRQIARIGRPGIAAGLMLAGAGIAYLQSITNTTVANTLFMLSAIPFFTAALAWLFLRETLLRSTVFTMLAAATGIGVMVAGGISAGSLYGNFMGLVTALCFSGYAIIVRRNRGVEMLPVLLVSSATIIVISFLLRWQDLTIPFHDILLCFLLGGVLSGLANILFIAAAKQLVAAELTLFMLLEFALGPLWVWFFIAERPTDWTILGGAIVIGSVTLRALIELTRSRKRTRLSKANPL